MEETLEIHWTWFSHVNSIHRKPPPYHPPPSPFLLELTACKLPGQPLHNYLAVKQLCMQDPGNLEGDLQAGANTGYILLWVLVWSTVMVCTDRHNFNDTFPALHRITAHAWQCGYAFSEVLPATLMVILRRGAC